MIPGALRGQEEPPVSRGIPSDKVYIEAVTQVAEGPVYRLTGLAAIETSEFLIRAEQVVYNDATGDVEAEGNVRYFNFVSGERLEASRVEYNLVEETGTFHDVKGEASAKFDPRPGMLTTGNPFVFEGEWAELLGNRYILHDGFLTNCLLPKPVWTLTGPKFDIVPNERALVYHSVFRVKGIPLLYAPVFYKSLRERPRKSGFLTPNIGNSSRRGTMIGAGYYWAINRSYDLMYRSQLFSQRGFAHQVDARGRPTRSSRFDVFLYGVNDSGRDLQGGGVVQASGFLLTATGEAALGKGFVAKADFNYLSSFLFRQEFTESFNEAVFSETHSVAYVTRNWGSYGFTALYRKVENFHSTEEEDVIEIRRLPSAHFNIRDREISRKVLPVWVSLDSSLGFLRRNQPLFQTRKFVERVDVAPRIMTALRWKDFHLVPAVSARATHYDSSWKEGQISGDGILRTSGEATIDLTLPALSRVYAGPDWLGDSVKHVIETEANFRRVWGVDRYDRYILFDETDVVANTTELDFSLTNRLYSKRNGVVYEVLSWQLWQRYFFDPEFGGAVTEPGRYVLPSSLDMTGYAFLDGPRNYSPIASRLRLSPRQGFGMSWTTDYDPMQHRFVNSGLAADARFGGYYISLGHNQVRGSRTLSPNADQFRGLLFVGDEEKRGWNAAFSAVYDFREDRMQFATTQVTYNSDCCGISFQYRRFGIGTRNENQFRVSFAIANIGSFGTLRRQEELF